MCCQPRRKSGEFSKKHSDRSGGSRNVPGGKGLIFVRVRRILYEGFTNTGCVRRSRNGDPLAKIAIPQNEGSYCTALNYFKYTVSNKLPPLDFLPMGTASNLFVAFGAAARPRYGEMNSTTFFPASILNQLASNSPCDTRGDIPQVVSNISECMLLLLN